MCSPFSTRLNSNKRQQTLSFVGGLQWFPCSYMKSINYSLLFLTLTQVIKGAALIVRQMNLLTVWLMALCRTIGIPNMFLIIIDPPSPKKAIQRTCCLLLLASWWFSRKPQHYNRNWQLESQWPPQVRVLCLYTAGQSRIKMTRFWIQLYF